MKWGSLAKQDRRKLTRSVCRFLAYCDIVRHCRPYVDSHASFAIVVVLPIGGNIDQYKEAAIFAFGEPEPRSRFDFEKTNFLTADENGNRKERLTVEGLINYDRLVVLAKSLSDVSEKVIAAADAVITLGPPEVGHVVAAARLCLKQHVTSSLAREMASMPLDLIAANVRRGRPVSRSIEMIRDILQRQDKPEAGQVGVEALHGFGEAAAWALELATDLKDWQAGKIAWGDVDRGILLSGAPGVGKTIFARALATTCGAHLVVGSIARWQACGHLGDLLKAMRAAFDEAKQRAPAIVFIDEVDAVGSREDFRGHSAQYSTEVVAGLLECIDGVEGRPGVIVVGACNYPQKLDPALVRPGRLDRHVRIPLPDGAAREGILRFHLAGDLADDDLSQVVRRTEEWSGAGLAKLVREARRVARRDRRAVLVSDLEASLPKRIVIPEELVRRAAIHECGHAMAYLSLGQPFEGVELSDVAEGLEGYQPLGFIQLVNSEPRASTAATIRDEICGLLAGIAAEEVLLGDRSSSGGGVKDSDLHRATLAAVRLEASFGLGSGLSFIAEDREPDLMSALRLSGDLRSKVDKTLAAEMARACAIIEAHQQPLQRASSELLARRRLSSDEFRGMIASYEHADAEGLDAVTH
ncbi:AAA family ATPase [Bosea caraganae]|uniref:AAA family ATPase n=1 Tax=Bosea caraganae TaxID=2763117 RepID=A0A370L9F2_9HYPH|nr:AAA family ATPase [Bosea caraganae]RDJ22011.1 AAA family ATPase [Bosea caraganae]RDJ27955.1 AAA family ATPase [Bosea caraganae]